ncbi:CBS domain-containing protein [Sphaerimonospora mesophila]|uniref:CBS domain-containing protein n=1 Tax=Sphaerimonospora mesophila TaxID=37483 RepID=UPI000AE3B0F8
MQVKVKDVMTRDVAGVNAGTPFKDIAELLIRRGVSAVPVVDDQGRVSGVVSETDLLRKEEFRERYYREGYRPPLRARLRHRLDLVGGDPAARALGDSAGELMTTPAVTVSGETSVVSAARLMDRHGVRRLPVVDGHGRLMGIVSRHDLLKVFVRPDEEIAREIAEDIVERNLWTDTSDIEITVRDGVVTVAGTIPERSSADIAIRLIRRVNGVVDVVNRLCWDWDDLRQQRWVSL